MNMNQIWIGLSYKMSTISCFSTNSQLEKTRGVKYLTLRAKNEDMEILKVSGYIFLSILFEN